jgi:hypothetical protein
MGTIDDLMSARAVILPDVVGWLLTYAVHSSLLLGLAWLCTRYVRPYRLKEILWKTALIGGLLTATLQFTLGINPLTGRFDLLSNASTGLQTRQIPTFQVTLAPSGAGATDPTQDYLWALNSVPGANADGQIIGSANQASPLPWNSLADALQIGVRWLLGLWLIGVTVALLRLGHISRRLHATLRDRRDIREGPLADILARLCQAAGVRKHVRLNVIKLRLTLGA